MTDFDAQIGREVPTDEELSSAQVASDEVDLAEGLGGLAAVVAGGLSLNELLGQVAQFAAHAVPGVDGAGVTLVHSKGATSGVAKWAVTAPFVREIDIIQYERLQEGPCITCMQDRVVVLSGALSMDRRWPRFGGRVARLGVASSMALPLLVADDVVGSINCYAYATDAFGEHAVRMGTQFAGPAAVSVFNARVISEARSAAAHLQRALVSRAVIDQAIGIIRARSGATGEEAFERLRHISQTENTKLHEVAERIVEDAVRRARARRPGS